ALAGRRNPADEAGAVAAARRCLEHHPFGLLRADSDQWLDCKSMGNEYERSRPAPAGHDVLELPEPRAVRITIRDEGIGGLDVAHGHQRRRVHAAAHGRGEDAVHTHAVAAESLTQCLALGAPLVVEVPLRLAVVEPEARRIAAVAGRRVPVANERDMAAPRPRPPPPLLTHCTPP